MRHSLIVLFALVFAAPSAFALKKSNATRAERREKRQAKEAREDSLSEEQKDAEEDAKDDERHDNEEEEFIRRPWSFGVGFSGYSINGQTVFTASGSVRYLWNKYTESLGGLGISFGSGTRFAANLAQRGYIPINIYFRPFGQVGVSFNDFSDFGATTLDVGGGFQAAFSPYSYFELVAIYQINTIFRSGSSNVFILQGGSGFRF